ncbi:hypothetical protein BDY19DRAFT_641954 [Irpex rosettiformis]|uniref:Uncharacterized protein n=1 Tax=Irpex rosettiformis TaxID=378272 RepID=A0ACB8UBL5_9APHY|nr:hypothetical protein BDY19DRAFT_641954 [Irpex rosettiformis]
MHPWHWHWHRPSRLLWFMVGAVTGAWAMKHKESADNYRVRHCSRYQIPQEAYPPPQGSNSNQDWHAQWHARWRDRHAWALQNQAQMQQNQTQEAPAAGGAEAGKDTPRPTPTSQGPVPVVPDQPATADGWDEERQRLLNIKQQAANSLLDFSEEGLDSLLNSMESLKAVSRTFFTDSGYLVSDFLCPWYSQRLAERRAQREQEARERAEREADFKQFEEWKRERATQAYKDSQEPKAKEPPKRLV